MLSAFAAGCAEGRFPVCKSNDDCAAKLADAGSGPAICYNLRCVECRYDTDCATGKICNATLSTCQDLSTTSEDPDLKAKPASTGSPDAKNWDECATSCKDSTCISACDQRFKK